MRRLFLTKLFFLSVLCSASAQTTDPVLSNESLKRGMIYFSQGNKKDALKYFQMAIDADSTNYDAWIKRGFTRGALEDFSGEIADYTFVIAKDPSHVHAYISRGSAYRRLSNLSQAMSDFNRALEIDPENQEAYNNRGFVYKAQGNMDQACQDWNSSRKLGNPEAKVILKNNYCK